MAWVDEACGGFFEKEQAGALGATDVYLFRVAAMLDDFAAHGAVLRRYSRSVEVFLSQSHRSGSELRRIGGAPAVGFASLGLMVGDAGPAGES